MFNDSSSHRNAGAGRSCRMIGVKLIRRLALPRGDGPSLAANSDSEHTIGQLLRHFPLKLASLVATCCYSATSASVTASPRTRLNPGHTPDLQLSVLVSSKVLLKTWL